MERWQNRVAVVTGASSGIGAAVAKDLAKAGLVVVALGRRLERLEGLRKELPQSIQSKFHPKKCDVSKEDEVKTTFKWINDKLGGVDVLINNAGIFKPSRLIDSNNSAIINEVIDTNVMGVFYCTREAFASMKSRNFDGHVVVVNSIAGHKIPNSVPQGDGDQKSSGFNIYPASKHAVTAMVETYRQEFNSAGTKIKITSVSPGVVNTEIVPEALKELVNTSQIPSLQSEDISNAILYALGTPPHVQVHELMIRPVGETF